MVPFTSHDKNFMKKKNDTALIILTKAFDEKRSRNPRYSLRAFSRDLGISASQLSSILSGHKKLSAEHACRIAMKLEFPTDKFVEFAISTL